MLNKPFSIAIFLTLLACIPLYFLSAQQFQITSSNLPVLALSLFVLTLVSAFWGNTASSQLSSDDYHEAERETGSVKWFNASKGFGFITRESGDDIFVHFRSIRGEGHRVLRDGQRVEFVVSEGEKGLQADDVAVAG